MSERDYRSLFLADLEAGLAGSLEPDQIQMVTAAAVRILQGYEITERCTELVPVDSPNEKIAKRYLACLLVDGKSKKTVYQYGRHLARLSETIRKDFTELTAYDIRYYLALQKERNLSNRSLENMRAALSAFFSWMTTEEIIPKNPMATIKPVTYVDEIRKPFSEVEIDALRSACRSKRDRALVEILLASGVRVSELSAMNVVDIDMVGMIVQVKHGKGGKERKTYVNPVACKHLRDYLKSRPEKHEEALFCNTKHERLEDSGIRYILKQIAGRAGVNDCHPHRFRRTFATSLSNRGMDVQEIQQLMGHSSITTTLQYISINDDRVKASYRKYSA